MKVTFDYQKTQEGYKLNMTCKEMTRLESGAYDQEEYHDCFKAILKHIISNHLSEVPLSDYEAALTDLIDDNTMKEFERGFKHMVQFGEENYSIDENGKIKFDLNK